MRKKFSSYYLVILIIGTLSLAGCGNGGSSLPVDRSESISSEATIVIDPPTIEVVENQKASVTGSIFSIAYDQAIVGIPVSLSEVIRDEFGDGVYVYDPTVSPTTSTTSGGYFVIENIEPGEYVLVVGNIEINSYKIISEDDGLPKIYDFPTDIVSDIGQITVDGMEVYIKGFNQQDGYPAPESYPKPNS